MNRCQWYVGIEHATGRRQLIYACEPNQELFGHIYAALIGPFRTKRGAQFMRDCGRNNPHCQCVADAERLARTITRTA